ncbi:MAG: LptF/LptG family permease [Paludibacteraceae bacterium]|nr:LptF/LptG family permease [Paludibacteraceae bacterium]
MYIIWKYLGTFGLSLVLILCICVVIDISEKLDYFFDNHAPLNEIVFDYYLNFIPYFANMLTPMFAFIAVIFFTSKMANNTEIIAILAGGVSFNRFLRPYFVASTIIVLVSFLLSGYVIPPANETRLDFEDKYVTAFKNEVALDIQLEIQPGVILYIERFEHSKNRGQHVSLEKYDGKKLVSRTTGMTIEWTPADSVWHIGDYVKRDFDGVFEEMSIGMNMDTLIDVVPQEFFINEAYAPQMTNAQLRRYIKKQTERGMGNTQPFEVEYHKRFSIPMASLILMLIGVSLSSRKVKGGMGLQLGIGIVLSALYILFLTVSSMFAVNGSLPTMLAVWLPNIIFGAIAAVLYVKAPK